jgi:uncharacterized Fe-S radical SAM superfamily protein PflX
MQKEMPDIAERVLALGNMVMNCTSPLLSFFANMEGMEIIICMHVLDRVIL